MIHTPMGHAATTSEPLDDAIDHVRGDVAWHVGGGVRFAFRHFPLTEIHPHALAESGLVSREVTGTPTLFIDGVVHRGAYGAATLLKAVAR
ncbi:MAG: hypothetical protein QOF83_3051 [Solirubrobacteraceae bacterium]|jgi:protein-disulfide isomerase|nr:hypothetical protein [Solirubrobacteraceae bacterium]